MSHLPVSLTFKTDSINPSLLLSSLGCCISKGFFLLSFLEQCETLHKNQINQCITQLAREYAITKLCI